MNKIYSFTNLMAAAVVLFAATACSDGYEYTPARPDAKGTQAYFDESLPKEVALTSETESFDIRLSRFNTEGEVTVNLTSTQPEEAIYTIPETATFADGEATTTFTVTVNPDDLVFDDMRTITISIDQTNGTPYAAATYTFTVGLPAPWTAWCNNAADFEAEGGLVAWPLGEVGTGDYTFGAMIGGNDLNRKVEFRQNKLTGECQFRILDLATDFYPNFTELVMDAYWMESQGMYALRIPMVETGYIHQGEAIYLSDRLTLAEIFSGATIDWNNADQYNPAMVSTYNPKTGLFSFNEVWYLTAAGSGWDGNETLQMHGFYIPDYTVALTYKGIYTEDGGAVSAVGNAEMGVDATDVRAVVLPQSVNLQSAAAALAALDAPTAALPYVTLSEAGRFEVPFDYAALASSKLQIVAVAASEGEAMYATAATFEYYGGGENPWKSIGTGMLTEDIATPLYFGGEAPTYEVEIFANEKEPGIYRVMNPFTESVHPFGPDIVELGGTMAPEGSFLEFNAEDNDAVYVPTQNLQCIIDPSDGELGYCTFGYYLVQSGQVDYATAKANGFFGKNANGVLRFPRFKRNDGSTYQGLIFIGNDGCYSGFGNPGMNLVLPEAMPEEQASAQARALRTKINMNIQKKMVRMEKDNKLHIKMLRPSQVTINADLTK